MCCASDSHVWRPVGTGVSAAGYSHLLTPYLGKGEVAGTVEAVGSRGPSQTGVSDLVPGDEIYGYLSANSGGHAEYVAAPASEFVRKPKQIDFDTAASVPVAALTAWQGIFDHGELASGQRILITGASGAVGSMAVQLAKNKGAYVIGTGSGRNEEFVRELGADKFIDYTKAKFEDRVSGADVVFDTVGGNTQERAFQTLKRGGVLGEHGQSAVSGKGEGVRRKRGDGDGDAKA
jgi:NADPH:quinone reductase-like Zn-dependent oxidoreductase